VCARWGRKRQEETVLDAAPDDEWLACKGQVLRALQAGLPEPDGTGDLVHGGVVFSHPKVMLDKARIQGNTAAYGPARAWVERLRASPPEEGFPPALQLKALDLFRPAGAQASASAEADRLYQEAVGELRTFVTQMVKD